MTQSSIPTSIDPKINEHIQMMHKDPSAYKSWAKSNGISPIIPEFIPDNVKQIYTNQADESLNPWYQNELAVGKAGVAAETGKTMEDYQRAVEDLNRGLQEDTATLADTEGKNGTWGSSARAERQNSLASKYQSKLDTAFGNASNQLGNTLRQGEYKYGTETPGLDSTMIRPYQTSGNGVTANNMSLYRYNPFGGQGTLNVGKKSASNILGSDYLQARIKSPTIQ